MYSQNSTTNSVNIRNYIVENITQSKATSEDLLARMNKLSVKTSLGKRLSDADTNSLKTSMGKDSFKAQLSKASDTSAMPLLKFNFDDNNQTTTESTSISNNVCVLQKNSQKIQGLEQMQDLLTKVKPGYSLSVGDYKIVANMNDLVQTKLKSGALSPADKMNLEKFTEAFQRLSIYKDRTEVAFKNYNQNLQTTETSTTQLSQAFADTEAKLKAKGISTDMLKIMMAKRLQAGVTLSELSCLQEGNMDPKKLARVLDKFRKVGVSNEMLNLFKDNYKEVMMAGLIRGTLDNYNKVLAESGNEPTIGLALYQAYIQKVVNYLNSPDKANDPGGLARIMNSYNNLVAHMGKISSSNISPEEKQNQLINLATRYAGNDPQQAELFKALVEKEFTENFNFSEAVNLVNGALSTLSGNGNSEDPASKEEPGKRIAKTLIAGADQTSLDIAGSADASTYKFIDESPAIKENLTKFTESNTKMMESTVVLLKEANAFSNEIKNFKKVMADPEIKKSLTNMINYQIKEEELTSDEKIDNNITKEINELLRQIDILQSMLDLSINPGETDITVLLESFRKIINKLDLDTRKLVEHELEAKLIDTVFSNKLKARKDKDASYENEKEKLKEVFAESNEVRLASLPSQLKEEKFSQNAIKMALLSLNMA